MDLTKADALASLKPNSEWTWDWDAENPTVREYDKLVWLDSDTKPTEAEIDAELIKLGEDISKLIPVQIRLKEKRLDAEVRQYNPCLLYTSPSPRDS